MEIQNKKTDLLYIKSGVAAAFIETIVYVCQMMEDFPLDG